MEIVKVVFKVHKIILAGLEIRLKFDGPVTILIIHYKLKQEEPIQGRLKSSIM